MSEPWRHRLQAAPAILLATAFVLVAGIAPAPAQNRVTEIATYQGADREKRLVEGARKEGELMFYASVPVPDIAVLSEAFTKKYGIKIKAWRGDSEAIMARALNEAKARRHEVGVLMASSSALEPLSREKLLTEVNSPLFADLIPESIAPHRQWASVYLNTFVQAYNTNLVRADELPKTYHDLLHPRWKGRLAVEAEDYDWFAQVVINLGEARGLKLFRDLVATNGLSVRRGHSVLNNLVVAGEIALGLSAYGFLAEQSKRKGAPLDWFVIPPLLARPTAAAVSRFAPQPHAAVLFYDFLLGDAEPILASRQFVSPSRKIDSPFTRNPLQLIDSVEMLDNARKWQELYQTIVLKPAR
ncbi:MAG: extracellular solute-binding protein [Hyphomicrobiales bacterium]|nr:extracellular solute-binding protein [Hyphomicrobiales bacterium]